MAKKKKWLPQEWDAQSISQEKAILKMVKANEYTPIKCTPKYYDWQYRRNPAGEANIMLAVDKMAGNLAGIYAVIPIDLMVNGERVRAALSLNTLTDIDYRGQGIFTGLAREVYKRCFELGWNVVIGYPNQNSHVLFLRALGFSDVGEIPLLLKLVKPSVVIGKKIPIPGASNLASVAQLILDPMFKFRAKTASRVKSIRRFDTSFDELNDNRARVIPIMVSRHSAYLNWRYKDCPIEYEALTVREADKILGYIVFRVMRFAGMRCGMILDLVVREGKGKTKVGRDLIRSAFCKMVAQDCVLLGALSLENSQEYIMFKKNGFFNCPNRLLPQPFPYIVRETAEGAAGFQVPFDLNNWFVSMGDYDAA
jgi:predicted N-acetyltransferase YhbS